MCLDIATSKNTFDRKMVLLTGKLGVISFFVNQIGVNKEDEIELYKILPDTHYQFNGIAINVEDNHFPFPGDMVKYYKEKYIKNLEYEYKKLQGLVLSYYNQIEDDNTKEIFKKYFHIQTHYEGKVYTNINLQQNGK